MITEQRTKLLVGCYEAIRQYGEDVIKINNKLMALDKDIDEVLSDLLYVCDKESGDDFAKVKEVVGEVVNNTKDQPTYEKVLLKTRTVIDVLDTHLSDVWDREYKEQLKKAQVVLSSQKGRLENAFESFQKAKRFSPSYKKSLDLMSDAVFEIDGIMLSVPESFRKDALDFPINKLGMLLSDMCVLCNDYNSDKGLSDQEMNMFVKKEGEAIEMLSDVMQRFLVGRVWGR